MASKDELLKKVGNFGLFQKKLVASITFSSLFSASMLVVCNVFVVYTPPHRCYIPEIDENANLTYLRNNLPEIEKDAANQSYDQYFDLLRQYVPIEEKLDGALQWSQCYRFLETNSSLSNRTQVACEHGWQYMVDEGVITASTQFSLVCGRAWLAPLATTMQLCGYLVGGLGGGYISDRYGRRFSLLLSWFLLMSSTAAISVLPVWEISCFFWMIIGIAVISKNSTSVVIINEWIPTKYRYFAGSLFVAAFAIGYMLLPLMNVLITNWRYFLGAYTALQFFAMILLFRYVKESLSWLLQNAKHEESLKLLIEVSKVNKKKLIKSDEEYLIDQIDTTKSAQSENEEKLRKTAQSSHLDLIKIPFLRKRLIIMSLAWTATVLNYQGLSLNTNSLGGNRYIACFLSAVVEIPGHILSFIGLKKLGGRTSYITAIALCGACLLITIPFQYVNQTAVIAWSMVGKLFATAADAITYLFVGDFFPTLLRNQAYGASNLPARIVAMSVPFLLYLGEQESEAIPYVVMGFFAMTAAFAVFFLPEVKGTAPLPETLEDARNQEKLVKTCRCDRKSANSAIVEG